MFFSAKSSFFASEKGFLVMPFARFFASGISGVVRARRATLQWQNVAIRSCLFSGAIFKLISDKPKLGGDILMPKNVTAFRTVPSAGMTNLIELP